MWHGWRQSRSKAEFRFGDATCRTQTRHLITVLSTGSSHWYDQTSLLLPLYHVKYLPQAGQQLDSLHCSSRFVTCVREQQQPVLSSHTSREREFALLAHFLSSTVQKGGYSGQ